MRAKGLQLLEQLCWFSKTEPVMEPNDILAFSVDLFAGSKQ